MKFTPFVSVTLMLGALVGWFAPGGPKLPPAAAEASAARGEDRLDVASTEQWYADDVILRRGAGGHFYADVSTDSGTVTMLIDTGASIVALTGEDAEAMGVEWDPADVQPVARGANGAVYGVNVTLDQIQLGQLEAQNVQAVVVPEGLGISLLGQSFLSKIDSVQMVDNKMVLGG